MPIMQNMVASNRREKETKMKKNTRVLDDYKVEEKTYNTMHNGGALSISFGVVNVVVGVVTGIILIVSGAKLMSAKRNIMF